MSSPLITVPTTRPRVASGASDAASGTTICATAELTPTAKIAATSARNVGATAATTSPAAVTASRTVTSRRRSRRSPSGTSRASATAYPSWDAVTSSAAVPVVIAKSPAIAASSGHCGAGVAEVGRECAERDVAAAAVGAGRM